MSSKILPVLALTLFASVPAAAKSPSSAPTQEPDALAKIADPSVRASVAKLMARFRWGMTPDEVMSLLAADLTATYDERLAKERDAFRQDHIRREQATELERLKEDFVKFDGHKTGWDVSVVDQEFAHNNDESMVVVREREGQDQRRFLFFYRDKLWKQVIAFNTDRPPFKGKNFDEFTAVFEQRFGSGGMAFRKKLTSDEQVFDHLEWPISDDFGMWATDMGTLYSNYCIVLMRTSVMDGIEKSRKQRAPAHYVAGGLVDSLLRSTTSSKKDDNLDIVDEITGRHSSRTDPPPVAPDMAPDDKPKAK
jgi:hypothetical protein